MKFHSMKFYYRSIVFVNCYRKLSGFKKLDIALVTSYCNCEKKVILSFKLMHKIL